MDRWASPPQVSVITPLYNSAPFIEETLASLLGQTYPHWESLLIDDGSTDDTAQIVAPYLKDPRFTYIRQENQGIAGARNTGIRAARGAWICLLDHDDRWLPTKLKKQLHLAYAKNCDIVFTDAVLVQGTSRGLYSQGFRQSREFGDVLPKVERSIDAPRVDVFALLIRTNFLCASSVMIHKSFFDALGLFNPAAAPADDYDLWLRCLPGARLGYVDEPLVEYLLHERNYSHDHIRMRKKIIAVLATVRGRYAGNTRRAKQFEGSLIAHYDFLFRELLREGRYAAARHHALLLLAEGGVGSRILMRSLVLPYLKLRGSRSFPRVYSLLRAVVRYARQSRDRS